jgi:hypothetical protein
MEKEYTIPKIMAGFLGSFIERKSLDDALKDVGLSEKGLLEQWLAPYNPPEARKYAIETMAGELGMAEREKGSDVYVVKKVLCPARMFNEMKDAVSNESNEKFKVVRIIGSNPDSIGYNQKGQGLEVCLTYAKNTMDALRKTAGVEAKFKYSNSPLNPEYVKAADKLITMVLYKHTPDAIQEFINLIGF